MLMTRFYQQQTERVSTPVERANAFMYLMTHKTIAISDGELIVGEKGPVPKAAPTFPELCCHSLEDLDILNTREKISFAVSPDTLQVYEDTLIPYWHGRSMREMILREMTPAWHDAYEAAILTEFMEQRSPGHTVLDDKIYHRGMLDFIAEIDARLAACDFLNDPDAYPKQEQLKGMRIAAQAIIRFANRYAEQAQLLAESESDPQRKAELERIAEVCTHVPAHAPRNFWEALQSYWFIHLGVTLELVSPGGPPHGLGSRLELTANGRRQVREMRSVASPFSASVPRAHFGVGDWTGPLDLVIRWPDGREQRLTLPASGAAYRIEEGSVTVTRLPPETTEVSRP